MPAGTAFWGKADLPASVKMVDGVPFTSLFHTSRSLCIMGGPEPHPPGLRAGVPSVVVPFFGDQPFSGLDRVADLGVGPAAIHARS